MIRKKSQYKINDIRVSGGGNCFRFYYSKLIVFWVDLIRLQEKEHNILKFYYISFIFSPVFKRVDTKRIDLIYFYLLLLSTKEILRYLAKIHWKNIIKEEGKMA